MQAFPLSERLKASVTSKLRQKEEIFTFSSEPLLASLVACLGLQFEMGKAGWDRLSIPLGLPQSTSWFTEIVTLENQIGIRMWVPELEEIRPLHPDFAVLLHPESLDRFGRLSQIVIFPALVAERYLARGLELVIVRDWALMGEQVQYLTTNQWEIESNSARFQAELMPKARVAFSGTHDLADHLLGGSSKGFERNRELYLRLQQVYRRVFPPGAKAKNRTLLISYLIGVLLDDMAQPAWYESESHREVVSRALSFLEASESEPGDFPSIDVPTFHQLMRAVRGKDPGSEQAAFLYLQDFCTRLFKRASA